MTSEQLHRSESAGEAPRYEIECRFVLLSEAGDPAALELVLGQAADRIWRVGDPRSQSPVLVHDKSG